MILRIVFLSMLFQSHAFSQNCKEFDEGIFEGNAAGNKYTIERHENFQLERMDSFGVLYLYKIEKISECEYFIKLDKVLSIGDLPAPNVDQVIKVKITIAENEKFYYEANLVGTEISLKGNYVKKSAFISDDFKKILENE